MEIHEIVRWSAWPSVLCYAVAVGLKIGPRPDDWRTWSFRFLAAGWGALVIHILMAMGLAHHWSLAEAYAHTAQQTKALVGWDWGGGVWLNFATLGVWSVLLLIPRNGPQPSVKWLERIAHGYLAFMMFNATVVFGSRLAQIASGVIAAGLTWWYCTPERPR